MREEQKERMKQEFADAGYRSALNKHAISEQLSLDEINKQAKEWAKERSVGNKKQDEECEYDFKCGMLAARSFLNK